MGKESEIIIYAKIEKLFNAAETSKNIDSHEESPSTFHAVFTYRRTAFVSTKTCFVYRIYGARVFQLYWLRALKKSAFKLVITAVVSPQHSSKIGWLRSWPRIFGDQSWRTQITSELQGLIVVLCPIFLPCLFLDSIQVTIRVHCSGF